MANISSESDAQGLSRRELLGKGATLAGAAIAEAAFQPAKLLGQSKPNSTAASMNLSIKAGTQSGLPNLDPPVVQVLGGKLRGFKNGKSTVFLGIPYAEAERFELPKPIKPWDGILSAQAWGPVSPVPDMIAPGVDEFVFPHRYWLQNEHCQVLNIWTQNTSRAAKKPVMVWMHGGGFTNGSSMEAYAYDGKNLSEFGDVVVVSLNHRLNIIGTLDLSAYGFAYAQSRYAGTADLVAALEWIHDNIENFGGDAGNVTIFGQSGGGGKVARMMHTPAAKGLFHKVICESGGNEVLTDSNPAKNIQIAQMIAAATLKNLNLNGDQIDQLKTVPYPQLLAAGEAALKTVAQETGQRNLGWGVFADDQYIAREFCDWADSIPLISGSVFSEHIGTLNKGTGKNEWTEKEIDDHLSTAYGDKKEAVVAAFKAAFPNKKVQDVLYFASPQPRALIAKREAGRGLVYNYIFSYEYPVNTGITSFHTSEIAFVFHNLNEPEVRVSTGEAPAGFALQDKVSRAWINFAHTGNPSQPGLEWKPFSQADPQTMVFDVVSECRNMHYETLSGLLASQGGFGTPAFGL